MPTGSMRPAVCFANVASPLILVRSDAGGSEVGFVRFTYPDDLDSKQALLWCLDTIWMQKTTWNKLILIPFTIPSTRRRFPGNGQMWKNQSLTASHRGIYARVWLLVGQIRSLDIVDGTSMLKQPNLEMLCTFSHTRKWTWDRFVTVWRCVTPLHYLGWYRV